jgi:Probable cobalt transporter subunit (CbtB)
MGPSRRPVVPGAVGCATDSPDGGNRNDEHSVTPSSDSTASAVAREPARQPVRVAALHSAGTWWLVAAALFSLLVYYFVGVDQGAVSVFGSDMHIHEFLHDGRHVLAFPCH